MKTEQITVITSLDISKAPAGTISRYWLSIVKDGMGAPILLPIMVAKGKKPGKVVGLTAAVHGNELNGTQVIQQLFKKLDVDTITGAIVGVPIVNVPSFLRKKRRFLDGVDINHIMPGKESGTVSQVYAWRIIQRIIKQFDILVDLHTASNGRVNSYYVRADMSHPMVKKMALLQQAQIIVHNPPNDGTLRGSADDLNIPAITMEVGDPNLFQKGLIKDGLLGINNLLCYLGSTQGESSEPEQGETVICTRSYWIYTDTGGLLTVHPQVTEMVKKKQIIATLKNVWGDVIREYQAPEDGIVIGKSVSPVNQAGGRILHLGIVGA